jgi:Flp pilus assembly pilin Flp
MRDDIFRVMRLVRRDRRGAVAAEFGLIAPLLFTLILGAIEYGGLLLSYSSMQFGGTVVTRALAVNDPALGDPETAVKGYLTPWSRGSVDVVVDETAPGFVETNLVRMRLEVPATEATPLPLLTRIVPWTLTATITMKQELPYVE